MKRLRLVILLFGVIILLSGCSAVYEVNVDINNMKESLRVTLNDDEYYEFNSDENYKYLNMYYNDPNNDGTDGVQLPLPGVLYYDFTMNESLKTVNFSGNTDYRNYHRSSIIKLGYEDIKVIYENDKLHLKTSQGFLFDMDTLENLKVVLKSDYRVLHSNCDYVDGKSLVWEINKSNYKTKYLSVDYSLSEDDYIDASVDPLIPVDPEDSESTNLFSSYVPILVVIGSLLLLGLIIFAVYLVKNKKNNRI